MTTTEKARQAKTYLPDEAQQGKIAEFITQFDAQFRESKTATLTSATGQIVELPETLFDVLRQAAEALSSGRGVSIIPQDLKLTTQNAADFLGISRPTLVKLLESGAIPFEKVGRHRRVTLRDLLTYRDKFRVTRRTALRQMARAGQEAGLLELTAQDLQTEE